MKKLYDFEILGHKVGLFDVAAIGGGIYIGICDGKGIPTSTAVQFFAKGGYSIYELLMTPLQIKLGSALGRWIIKSLEKVVDDKARTKRFEKHVRNHYRDQPGVAEYELSQLKPRIKGAITDLESKLEDPHYVTRTAKAVSIASSETWVGYGIGRIIAAFS